MERAKQVTLLIAAKTREAARALKGTDSAWLKGTAEGAVTQAQRFVLDAEEKATPKEKQKVDKETQQVVDAVEQAEKEAFEQTAEELLPGVDTKKKRRTTPTASPSCGAFCR